MYLSLQRRLAARLRKVLGELYGLDRESIPVEQPPDLALGEYASPIAMELARTLRKAPRKIAEEIAAALGPVGALQALKLPGQATSMPGLIERFS